MQPPSHSEPNELFPVMPPPTVHVVFPDTENDLPTRSLALFLYHLEVVYTILLEHPASIWEITHVVELPEEKALKILLEILQTAPFTEHILKIKRAQHVTQGFGLQIVRISKASPLEIWFLCLATPLVLALIISGGNIECSLVPPRLKAKMAPLGTGIQKLKTALGKGSISIKDETQTLVVKKKKKKKTVKLLKGKPSMRKISNEKE